MYSKIPASGYDATAAAERHVMTKFVATKRGELS